MMGDRPLTLARLYFGIAGFQALHSIEEYLTGLYLWMPLVSGRLHERITWMPVFDMGERIFAAANMAIIAALFALSPFVFLSKRWALRLAYAVAVIEILNGIGHLVGAIAAGGYFPGVLAGIGLAVFGFVFLWAWKRQKEVL